MVKRDGLELLLPLLAFMPLEMLVIGFSNLKLAHPEAFFRKFDFFY